MTSSPSTPAFPFAIGCPVWACDAWGDVVYPARCPRRQWLAWYSQMFNTVEGNSTFYALPSMEVAKRWANETADGFHFALKFPRDISHGARLENSSLLDQFIAVVSLLHASHRAGPSFLQLPPWLGHERFDELVAFLERLPKGLEWAVEPRHLDWFDLGKHEQALNEAIDGLGMNRVIFDSRALFQSPAEDEIEAISQKRKPNVPVRFDTVGRKPLLRIVGRNRIELADSFTAEWLPVIDRWVTQGFRPYVFMHSPDDRFAPAFARRTAEAYRHYTRLGQPSLPTLPALPRQLSLFGDE